MKRATPEGLVREHVFGSVDEMLREADRSRRVGHDRCAVDRPSFIGRQFENWGDVIANANGDWPVGQRIVQKMLQELEGIDIDRPTSVTRRRCWSEDAGDELCVDRLRAGQPYWQGTSRQRVAGSPIVSIVVNVTASAYRNASDILWRGAVGVMLTDLLERAGYRAEFWGVSCASRAYEDGLGCFRAVCLKRADQPLDLPTLINGTSGWFYRTIYFQSYWVDYECEPSDGLGHPCSPRLDQESVRELCGANPVTVIDGVWSRDAAIAKVREVIEQLNQ